MAYYGYEPSKVAVSVGQGVITSVELGTDAVNTIDILNDAVTPSKIDDDGTGFQMGTLGLGGAVSGAEKLTVTGTSSFSGAITGDLTGDVTGQAGTVATIAGLAPNTATTQATQGAITSVGTLTGLTVSNASAPQLIAQYDGSTRLRVSLVGSGVTTLATDNSANIDITNGLKVGGSVGIGGTPATGNHLVWLEHDHATGFALGMWNKNAGGQGIICDVNNDSSSKYLMRLRGNNGSDESFNVRTDGSMNVLGNATFAGDVQVGSDPYTHISWGNSNTRPWLASLNNTAYASATFGWQFFNDSSAGDFIIKRNNNSTTANNVLTLSRSSGNATFAGDVTVDGSTGITAREGVSDYVKTDHNSIHKVGGALYLQTSAGEAIYLRQYISSAWKTSLGFDTSGNATFGGNVILDDGDTNNSNNLTFENTGYTNYEMDCTSGGFRLFRTGQSVALSADVNHIVTRPQQPSFLAYSLGFTKGSASSGWEEIGDSLTTVDHNVGGHLSGGTFTAPVDGIYQFSFGGYSTYSDTDGYNRYAIAFSHTDYDTRLIFGGNYSNSDSPMSGGSITIKMTANETMKLKAYSSIASATTWGNSSHAVWWSGHLLG